MMVEKSSYYTNNTVDIRALINYLLNRFWVVLTMGCLGALAVLIPGLIEMKNVQSELPSYYQAVDILLNSEFEDNSMLASANMALSDEVLEEAMAYNDVDVSPEDARKAITYRLEAKNVIRFFVYGKDPDTVEKAMNGIINVSGPIMAEVSKSESWRYDLESSRPQKVKIEEYINDGTSGLLDVTDTAALDWDKYLSEYTGLMHLLKNTIVMGVALALLTILVFSCKRLMSTKLYSLRDVENISELPVLGVVSKGGNGIAFVSDAIAKLGKDAHIKLTPIVEGIETYDIIKRISQELEEKYSLNCHETASVETNYDLFDAEDKSKTVLFIEDEKVNEVQLKNTLDLIAKTDNSDPLLVITGVQERKIKNNKEYFGKYYR